MLDGNVLEGERRGECEEEERRVLREDAHAGAARGRAADVDAHRVQHGALSGPGELPEGGAGHFVDKLPRLLHGVPAALEESENLSQAVSQPRRPPLIPPGWRDGSGECVDDPAPPQLSLAGRIRGRAAPGEDVTPDDAEAHRREDAGYRGECPGVVECQHGDPRARRLLVDQDRDRRPGPRTAMAPT